MAEDCALALAKMRSTPSGPAPEGGFFDEEEEEEDLGSGWTVIRYSVTWQWSVTPTISWPV